MTIFPGDIIDGRYEVQRLIAYQGKEGCTDPRCTRRGGRMREDGTWESGECVGWHCPLCDASCSSQGHNCPRAAEVNALRQTEGPER